MTSKQQKVLQRHISTVGKALGLAGWVIEVSTIQSSEGTHAEVSPTYGRRHAIVQVAPHFWDLSAGERHEVIVHELLHVVTGQPFTYLGETLPAIVGQPAWTAINEAIHMQAEHMVDQLATAIAPLLSVMEEA